MELFKNTNYDFLGKKWPFIIASLVLTVAGFSSILVQGGLKFGIDFKGGALMTVKFAAAPPIDKIRTAFARSGTVKGDVSVQTFTGSAAANEVEIGTELLEERQLNANRQAMESVLAGAFGGQPGGKLDLNNTSQSALVERLREPIARAAVPMTDDQLNKVAVEILKIRDTPPRSGVLTDFGQLASAPGVNSGILNTLKQECYLSPYHIIETQMVGAKVGAELRNKAVLATLYALAGMLIYIAFRFEWIYGVAAVVAVFHDTLITIGLFSIFREELSMTVIAALLTLVGYSMNDTIVIFDRIRENLKLLRREPLESLMNKSVNQTLSRTIMSAGLTFLTVVALFIWGGPVLHGFSFALVCGITVGTYSSVFIASPIVLFWNNYTDRHRKTAPVLAAASRAEAARKSPSKAAK
jgi:preprotein translocase subunit SecF